MDILKLTDEIIKIEIKLKHASDLKEKIELGREYARLLDKLDEVMNEELKSEPFLTAKELLSQPEPEIETIKSGIKIIDDNLGGIIKGAFIQLAAASGAGKTTLTIKILSNISKHVPVLHFDFEMGKIKLHRILKKYLKTDKQKENYKIDTTHIQLDDLLKRIKLGIKRDIGIFLIDSKMKIETEERDNYKASSIISHELSKLCRDYNITIILINQMSEEALKNGYPSLKGSGNQVYDSDLIFFLGRIPKKRKEGEIQQFDETKRMFVCSKNRFGSLFSGTIERYEIMPDYEEEKQAKVIDMPLREKGEKQWQFIQ